jgi:hypothetical protein
LRQRRAQEVAAEPFESEPVIGADIAIGVKIESLETRVTRADGPHPRGIGGVADAQHGRAGAVAEGRTPADRGGAELGEYGRIDRKWIGLDVLAVRGKHAATSQEPQDARANRREQVGHFAIGRRGAGSNRVVPSGVGANTPSSTSVWK